MKKVFPLRVTGKKDARVVESIKHDVRKYVKRERRKTLPEGFSEWDFDCRVGATAATASATTLKDIGKAVDVVATPENTSIYIEIVARASHRTPRAAADATNHSSTPPPDAATSTE